MTLRRSPSMRARAATSRAARASTYSACARRSAVATDGVWATAAVDSHTATSPMTEPRATTRLSRLTRQISNTASARRVQAVDEGADLAQDVGFTRHPEVMRRAGHVDDPGVRHAPFEVGAPAIEHRLGRFAEGDE